MFKYSFLHVKDVRVVSQGYRNSLSLSLLGDPLVLERHFLIFGVRGGTKMVNEK